MAKEQMFKKKYEKYTKILNQLTWLNACSSGISVATGISSVATHTAFVKALNKILTERLFKVQDAQELNDPEKVSATWVKHLYGLVDELNDTETEMIGMKPKDVIKLDEVPLVKREAYPPEEVLPEDGLYRYLLRPSEEHDDQRHRAMNRVWSRASYRLKQVVESPGNQVMYYLKDGPERSFVSEELMLIPEDTELPPDYVQAW